MPIYEFQCTNCNQRFDMVLSFMDSLSNKYCPYCGGESRRVYFAAPTIYKTGGFFKTDNRNNTDKE
jgi:putative FmdB family regulatory protein